MPYTVTHFTTQQLLSLEIPLCFFFNMAQEPNSGLGRPLLRFVLVDNVTQTAAYKTQNKQNRGISTLSAGFKLAIPAIKWPQT